MPTPVDHRSPRSPQLSPRSECFAEAGASEDDPVTSSAVPTGKLMPSLVRPVPPEQRPHDHGSRRSLSPAQRPRNRGSPRPRSPQLSPRRVRFAEAAASGDTPVGSSEGQMEGDAQRARDAAARMHALLVLVWRERSCTRALDVLDAARDIAKSAREHFAFLPGDTTNHEALGAALLQGTQHAELSEQALEALLGAYVQVVGPANRCQLAEMDGLLEGLIAAVERGSHQMQSSSLFLLSQVALAGPATAIKLTRLPGLLEVCTGVLSSRAEEDRTLNAALLVNNLSALGGEEAVDLLTQDTALMRHLASWLDEAHDASTLQRLTGVFHHLSRSIQSARALHAHGVLDALRRLVTRPDVTGSEQAHAAFVGLAHMAMANIIVRQEHQSVELLAADTPALMSVVFFLDCALAGRMMNGIHFRVYDVLYALDSLCRCKARELVGIECGLVDRCATQQYILLSRLL